MVRFTGKQPLALLRVLLACYVHYHANEARGPTILAGQALATRLDPANTAVLSQQAVFLNIPFPGGDCPVDGVSDPLCVLRMDARKILRQRCASVPFGGIDR